MLIYTNDAQGKSSQHPHTINWESVEATMISIMSEVTPEQNKEAESVTGVGGLQYGAGGILVKARCVSGAVDNLCYVASIDAYLAMIDYLKQQFWNGAEKIDLCIFQPNRPGE